MAGGCATAGLDRVCWSSRKPNAGSEAPKAFEKLVAPVARWQARRAGGLDVPHWLRRLEAEVERHRSRFTPGRCQGRATRSTLVLTIEDLQRQLENWETPPAAACAGPSRRAQNRSRSIE